ncbi:MAG: hypothetical protein ACOCX2_05475 [Armatimonadota bacterium]
MCIDAWPERIASETVSVEAEASGAYRAEVRVSIERTAITLTEQPYRAAAEGLVLRAEDTNERVEAALALVERWPAVRGANDEPYTLDVTALDAARDALAEAIVNMQAAVDQ